MAYLGKRELKGLGIAYYRSRNQKEKIKEEIKHLISYGGNINEVNKLQKKLKELSD